MFANQTIYSIIAFIKTCKKDTWLKILQPSSSTVVTLSSSCLWCHLNSNWFAGGYHPYSRGISHLGSTFGAFVLFYTSLCPPTVQIEHFWTLTCQHKVWFFNVDFCIGGSTSYWTQVVGDDFKGVFTQAGISSSHTRTTHRTCLCCVVVRLLGEDATGFD